MINGLKRTGKTTAADTLAGWIKKSIRLNFADHLKTMTHAVYGLPSDPNYFESVKDQPLAEFGGASPRNAYIYMSEYVVKPRHGDQFFGAIYLRKSQDLIKEYGYAENEAVLISGDVGFASETIPPLMHYGTENAILIRMHRAGASTDGDSRGHFWPQDIANSSAKYNSNHHKIEHPYTPGSNFSDQPPLFDADVTNINGQMTAAAARILDLYNALSNGAEWSHGVDQNVGPQ